ncbi:MAG: hypothetical protein ACR2OC_04225 [Solirubrobacterales bacterium]
MRDLVVRESLRNLAQEASDRFRELVRSGEEVPYEVLEPGQGSPLATYAPLSERFIRERTALVARLDAFGPAKAAIIGAGLTRNYLEALNLDPVPSEGRRAEDTIVAFLCRLWDGRSDFAFDSNRVEEAINELEDSADADLDEVEVVVPLIGLKMTSSRLELAGATVVRSDVVEAPPEASSPEGGGRAGWEPQFLLTTRCKIEEIEPDGDEEYEPSATPLAERFRTVITALRLFKPGGVGLGPHAWIRTGGGRWRRIATGSGRPRPGAYRLADSELGALSGLSRALERGTGAPSALPRAVSRFEAGLARDAVLEALNDHLLALRFLLEGDGPAKTDMAWRVAALCAEPGERDGVRATIDRAQSLERELWSGEPALGYDGLTPLDVASEIEDFTRAILRDAACGHLGTDLRATADEILLADGLAAGEGSRSQRGETSEWGMGEVPEILIEQVDEPAPAAPAAPTEVRAERPPTIELEAVDEPIEAELAEIEGKQQELDVDNESVPPRTRDGWTPFVLEGGGEVDEAHEPEHEPLQETQPPAPKDEPMEPAFAHEDWMAEAAPGGDTLDFPRRGPAMRLLDQRPEERKAMRERVSNLFPDPETTDWSIGELADERRRRAEQ